MLLNKVFRSLRLQRLYKRLNPTERPCPLCSTEDAVSLSRRDRNGLGLRTVACQSCGLIFTSPFLSQIDLDRFYSEMYRGQTKGQTEPGEFLSTRSWMEIRARYFLEQMKDQIGNQHLDFGCGEGSLVQMLHHHLPDIQIHLIEPDPVYRSFAASHCKGKEWVDLSELADAGVTIDSISVIHVLEHVIDPVSVLVAMRSILSPGGRVLIDVPDVTRYETLSDLHVSHCTHFCADTLTVVLNKAGFKVLKCLPHDPPHLPKSIWIEATPSEVAESINYQSAVSMKARQRSRAGIERANQSLLRYTLNRIVKG